MHDSDDNDGDALQVHVAAEGERYDQIKSINLQEFEEVKQLLKVRKEVQKIMSISREHDSNPYNFVMNKVGKNGLRILRCYFFFYDVETQPEEDVCVSQEMGSALMGNTDILHHDAPYKRS